MQDNIINEIKKLVDATIISTLNNDGAIAAFAELYTKFPDQFKSAIPRETFMNFCFANQKLIFSNINRNTTEEEEPKDETKTKEPITKKNIRMI